MPKRIESDPTTPDPNVASAAAQCTRSRTAEETRTAVHIAVSAARFDDGDRPPSAASRRSGPPSHRLFRSHSSTRGELFEKQYDAMRTKTVVGTPGTITPTTARATAHQPSAP